MSSKTTWSLIVAAGVLFALIYFVERPMREARHQPVSRLVLPGLDPAAALAVSIHPANQMEVRVVLQSNVWQLAKPISYPADNQKIQSFLIGLATLEWQDVPITAQDLRGRTNELEEFGFVEPRYSIEIRDSHGSRALRVGTNSALGDKVFLQVGGSEVIYAANAGMLQMMPTNKDAWRDTDIARLDGLAFDTISVRSGTKTFELHRDAQGLWRVGAPLQARADTAKVEALLGQLQAMRASRFVIDDTPADLEPYGLQASAQTPQLKLSFLQNTNPVPVLELQMGSSPTNHPELAYIRRQIPGNILLAPREPLALWQAAYTEFLDHHLISTPADKIESISVSVSNKEQFVVGRQGGGWRVRSADGEAFAADAGLMNFVIDTLTNAPTEVEHTVVTAFESNVASPVLTYTLRGPETNLIAQLQFGANQDGRVFEHRTDETSGVNGMFAVDFDHLPRAAWQLRDRRIWSFQSNSVVSVTVHQSGKTRKFIRDPNQDWTFAPGLSGGASPANLYSMDETLYQLGQLTAIYWDAEGDAGLDRFGFAETAHQVELELKTTAGVETLKIEFGKRSPYQHPYASVMLQGKRRVFEFPAPLFERVTLAGLTIPPPSGSRGN